MAEEPELSKRTRYGSNKGLSDAELLRLLEQSDDEEDPFSNDSEDDPDYNQSTASNSSDEDEVMDVPANVPPQLQLVPNDEQISDWNYAEVPPRIFPCTKRAGLLVNVNNPEAPLDYFNLFATDEFIDMLCTRANRHAIDLIALGKGEEPRISRWVNVTPVELRRFLGLLFHMGTIKLNRVNDYWKKHYLFNLQCFSAVMSRNRFLLILRALQFEDMDTQVPLTQYGKIKPIIDFFNDKMREIYYPKRELSIDESMVLWRGRLSFRQYVKGKRHKFGIKLYALCEPTGLVQNLIVYTGSSNPELTGTGHTSKVVLSLMKDYLDNGHSLFMDNYYNSVPLTKKLLDHNTYVTGTLRSNRKDNPAEVVKKKLKKGELIVQFNSEGMCVVKWKDRREILAISSEYNANMQNITSRRGQDTLKPNLIHKYNQFMAGVDHSDQMLSYYTCEHKTIVWYKKLAIHLFQIMLLNSYYLYKQGHFNNCKGFYEFRLSVIESLVGPPPSVPVITEKIHLPQLCPRSEGSNRVKKRKCQACKENENARKDSIYYCPLCPNQPGLCLDPCFRMFHKYQ